MRVVCRAKSTVVKQDVPKDSFYLKVESSYWLWNKYRFRSHRWGAFFWMGYAAKVGEGKATLNLNILEAEAGTEGLDELIREYDKELRAECKAILKSRKGK